MSKPDYKNLSAAGYWPSLFQKGSIDRALFKSLDADDVQDTQDAYIAALFKEYVRVIYVEVFSYCNRRCSYCPVKNSDRIGENRYMDLVVYDKILLDLMQIDYSGKFVFNLYNELLADPVIFEYLGKVRPNLPNTIISMNSKGDYLDPSNLNRLESAGVNEIYVAHSGRGR